MYTQSTVRLRSQGERAIVNLHKYTVLTMFTHKNQSSVVSVLFLQVLAESRPDRCGWLLRYFDEIYTSLDVILEHYYLRKYCKYVCNL